MEIDELVRQRGTTHGDFDTMAQTAEALEGVMGAAPNWQSLTPTQRLRLKMAQVKIARILCGDADHEDHWFDAAGYLKDGGKPRQVESFSGCGVGASPFPPPPVMGGSAYG